MRKGRLPNELFDSFRAMSVDVGKLIPFLKETACMNAEERVNLALCRVAQIVFEEDKEFCDFIEEIPVPFFKYTGQGKWGRDVVTDLGFALAGQKLKRQDVSQILKFDPSKLSQLPETSE